MITHEQAYVCRLFLDGRQLNFDQATASLQSYEAHHTTIETTELERLRALERKIEVFLKSIELRNTTAWNAAIHCRVVRDRTHSKIAVFRTGCGTAWLVRDDRCEEAVDAQDCGDAMRKAFELFEAPGDGV